MLPRNEYTVHAFGGHRVLLLFMLLIICNINVKY